MADIDRIVNVTIERKTAIPSVASFDSPLLAAEFLTTDITPNMNVNERVRAFGSLEDVKDAFGLSSVMYDRVASLMRQSPSVNTFYIGRKKTGGEGSETWSEALDAMLAENDSWYGVLVYTRTKSEQQDAADWVELNNRLLGLASGDSDIKDATGDIAEYLATNEYDRSFLFYHPKSNDDNICDIVFDIDFVTDNSIAVTINTELTTIPFNTDQDTTMDDIKADIEANANLAGVQVTLTDEDGNNRSLQIYYEGTSLTVTAVVTGGASQPVATITYSTADEYPATAWIGKMFPKDPGSGTWAMKTLTGVSSYKLSTTQILKIEDKNGNYYTTVAGIAVTQFGTVGSGEYIDIIRGIDWLKARIQELVFTPFINLDKIPYTDGGIEIINTQLKAALQEAVDVGLLESYETEVPLKADISEADKAARILPDVKFTAILAGAIHRTQIIGSVSL